MKLKRAIIIAINQPGYYSLAIYYLKLYAYRDNYLKKRCKIYTIEYDSNINDSSVLNNLSKLQPDLVAFSCYVWNINKVIILSKKIKKLLPLSKLVLGGQEVTNSTINFLEKYPFLDIIVDGEGERTFKQIVYSMVEDSFNSLDTIRGIQYRHGTGIRKNPPSDYMNNLDEIPSPYLEEEAKIPNNSPLGIMIDHVRGCPNSCGFCFEAMRTASPKAFSLERVKEELTWAKSKGYDYFHIMDPILCMNNPKKMGAMNTIFKELFHKESYRVSVEIYAENINKDNSCYLDCYHIFDIGLQTTNPLANRKIARKLNLNRFLNGFDMLIKLKKITNVYLIYGLPGDDYDKFMESICVVDSLKPSAIFLNKLCVLDGTPLRHNSIEYDLRFESNPPYEIISNMTYSYNDIIKPNSFAQNFMRYYNSS